MGRAPLLNQLATSPIPNSIRKLKQGSIIGLQARQHLRGHVITNIKRLAVVAALSLTGCGHIVTLYPRGGGEQATGTLNDGSRNMTINLKGVTYTGQFVRGQTFGFGIGQSFGARPAFGTSMMVGGNNQSSALLVSNDGSQVLRCELTVIAAIGGNGVCVDKDNITYDMNVKAQ